jgi:Asp-tRNA(Asn)/Glu-tRNA(Gln) amidotransferase A subunit family amidase
LHETPEGIPVGVQLVGPPGRDDLVIALAAQLESAGAFVRRTAPTATVERSRGAR